jgi:succinate dehydrogenase hydrophobic anchor subunit
MFRLIRNEWGKLKLPVVTAIALLTVTTIVLSGTIYKAYTCYTELDAWEIGVEWTDFLFPLFVVIPICWCMYSERKDNFLLYTATRVSKSRYLAAKWIVSAISAFTILFVPYFLSAIFAMYVKPSIPEREYFNEMRHVFYDTYVNTPLLYALLLSLWKGIIGVLVMSLGFVLSLYVRNIFVILTAPFIYFILENFTFSILGKPEYRLATAFVPTSISNSGISALSFIGGPSLLIVFTTMLWLFFAKIRRTDIYPV